MESILKRPVIVMALLTGLFMAICLLADIRYGTKTVHSLKVGATLAITAFAFFRIVCTFESRSLTDSILRSSAFDCKEINLIVLGEIVLALFVVEFDVLQRLLGTTALHGARQWTLAIAPAAVLFILWELGKLIARRARAGQPAAQAGPGERIPASGPRTSPASS
jgi:P-type Ca2+ transporter type 2C